MRDIGSFFVVVGRRYEIVKISTPQFIFSFFDFLVVRIFSNVIDVSLKHFLIVDVHGSHFSHGGIVNFL